MNFEIPEEYSDLIESVRRFRETELVPLEAQFLLDGRLEVAKRFELEETGRRKGLWALDVPEEYGGQGLSTLGYTLVCEELYRSPVMFDFGGEVEPALYELTEEQQQDYLAPVVNGEKRCFYAFTEPGGGSDLSAITTRAVREGDSWRINGTKTFISHADRADFFLVFASTDKAQGARGITCFIVDKGTPGFELSRPIPTMGDDWDPYELTFTDCVIPDSKRVGEINQGWGLGAGQLNHGRLKIAAYQLGIAAQCIDIATEWAKNRTTWGKPLATRQAIQWMLADSLVELDAARLLVHRAAWMHDEGKAVDTQAYMAKLYATEMAQRVTDRCLQILGGMGYTREVAVQSFYRQVRVWRIGHGASEIMRWMIARNHLGLSSRD